MKPLEKKQWLEDNSSKIEEGQYFRPFDGEDMTQSREDFTMKSIELSRIESEFDLVKAEFKTKIKAIQAQKKLIMGNLMQQGEWLDGKQFLFDDQETGMMYSFDETGKIIAARRLKPEERQLTIATELRKAQ